MISNMRWLMLIGLFANIGFAAEQAGEKVSPFSGDLATSIVTLITFGLLLIVLGKYAWKPMMEAIMTRESQIRNDLQKAQDEKKHADELLEEYQQLLEAAQAEVEQMMKEASVKAEEIRKEIIAEAQKQAKETIVQAKEAIEQAQTEAVRELYAKSADIAVELTSKILQREVNSEDHRVLIQNGLQELAKN